MLTSRGLPRWISTNDKSVVSRGSLELGRSTRKPFSLLFSGIGKCRYAALPFRGALSFTTIFFMSALAFQRLVAARVFFLRDRQNSETLAGIFAARNIR